VSDAKTGTLYIAAAQLGLIASGVRDDRLDGIAVRFGRSLGRLHQWFDDMADGERRIPRQADVGGEFADLLACLECLPTPYPVRAFVEQLQAEMKSKTPRTAGAAESVIRTPRD